MARESRKPIPEDVRKARVELVEACTNLIKNLEVHTMNGRQIKMLMTALLALIEFESERP